MSPKIRRWLVFGVPWPLLLLSLLVGPSDVLSFQDMWEFARALVLGAPLQEKAPLVRAIFWDIRVPRVLLAFLVGGALASSGATLQAIFRNPLVSPYVLGLSSGAAFGTSLALATSLVPVYPSAFVFGLIAVGCSYALGRVGKTVSPVSLVLSGIIVSGFFTSLLTVVQFLTDPFKLQSIVHWTMGNMHNADWNRLRDCVLFLVLGCGGMFLLRWRMNVLALGDQESWAVGIHPEREKIRMLIPATLAASAAVAAAGVIGMVGLVVPHMVRMILGPDNRMGIPACMVFGGGFLLFMDNLARSLTAFELPIGIFTTLVGGPFFVFLLRRTQLGWHA